MARTNGQNGPPNGMPAPRRPANDRPAHDSRAADARAVDGRGSDGRGPTNGGYPPSQYQEPAFGQPPQGFDPYHAHAPAQPGFAPDYGQPDYGHAASGHPQQPPPAPQTPYYQPPFDPYGQHGARATGHSPQAHDPSLRAPSYDQWGAAGAPHAHGHNGQTPAQFHDPAAYDLGHYMPAGSNPASHYARAPEQRPAPADPYSADPYDAWAQQNAAAAQAQPQAQAYGRAAAYAQPPAYTYPPQAGGQAFQEQAYQEPSYQGYTQPQQAYTQEPGFGHGSQSNGAMQAYENAAPEPIHDDHEEPEYETSGGRRMLTMMAALIGAVCLGSGMVYGYKFYLGRPATGNIPIVKQDAGPNKTAPSDPGGTKFANSDSKLLNRVDGTAANGLNADPDSQGPKKVATVAIGRDGQILPPVSGAPVAMAGIPGLAVVDGMRGGAPMATGAPPQASQPLPPAAMQLPPAASPPMAAVPAPPLPPAGVLPKAAVKKQPPAIAKKPPAAATGETVVADAALGAAALAPPATTAAIAKPRVAVAPNGYGAVIASKTSSTEALAAFADMQQKYPAILQGRTPMVQESDQTAKGKGVVQRLMVGPPGSLREAYNICAQLKAAGHLDCWANAY